jgi:hypothetical protein
MASLFHIKRNVITKNINNIFKTGELDKMAVCAKIAHTVPSLVLGGSIALFFLWFIAD